MPHDEAFQSTRSAVAPAAMRPRSSRPSAREPPRVAASKASAAVVAAVCSKIVERDTEATTAADAFDAATLGGAHALGRDDLGRIAAGATADLVLWKASSWGMTPLRDPIKNIVYNATAEDVDRVWVSGRLVVDRGRVLAADEAKILADLQAAGARMWPRMKQFDWAGRSADELSPLSYREWE